MKTKWVDPDTAKANALPGRRRAWLPAVGAAALSMGGMPSSMAQLCPNAGTVVLQQTAGGLRIPAEIYANDRAGTVWSGVAAVSINDCTAWGGYNFKLLLNLGATRQAMSVPGLYIQATGSPQNISSTCSNNIDWVSPPGSPYTTGLHITSTPTGQACSTSFQVPVSITKDQGAVHGTINADPLLANPDPDTILTSWFVQEAQFPGQPTKIFPVPLSGPVGGPTEVKTLCGL